MKTVLIVSSSARPRGVGRMILDQIYEIVSDREKPNDEVEYVFTDLSKLRLPLFDEETIPSAGARVIENPSALLWSNLVKEADAVMFLTPEYNHSMSASQKNAIDWLYDEWDGKDVSLLGYGWSGGSIAVESLQQAIKHVGAKLCLTNFLTFGDEISPETGRLSVDGMIAVSEMLDDIC